jgi:hypothetical protein
MQATDSSDTSWVTDEVWAQLDPAAGRPTPLSMRAATIVAAASVLVIAVVMVPSWLGAWNPRVAVADGWGTTDRRGSEHLAITFTLANNGPVSERITAISGSAQLRVTSVTGLPSQLGAHSSVPVTVQVQILDCGATDQGDGSLYVQVHRPWGHIGKHLSLPGLTDPIETACKAR